MTSLNSRQAKDTVLQHGAPAHIQANRIEWPAFPGVRGSNLGSKAGSSGCYSWFLSVHSPELWLSVKAFYIKILFTKECTLY
jgi:hypothetical protein